MVVRIVLCREGGQVTAKRSPEVVAERACPQLRCATHTLDAYAGAVCLLYDPAAAEGCRCIIEHF